MEWRIEGFAHGPTPTTILRMVPVNLFTVDEEVALPPAPGVFLGNSPGSSLPHEGRVGTGV